MKSKKLWWGIWGTLGALMLVIVMLVVLRWTAWDRKIDNFALAQVGESQTIKVDWKVNKEIDSLQILVKHGDDTVYEEKITDKEQIALSTKTVPAYYGKQKVTVKITWKVLGSETFKEETKEIGLSASEYNIAPLVATMPVTMLAFKLNEITNNNTIPTFIYLERGWSMNYSALPEGTSLMPFVKPEQASGYTNIEELNQKASAWIKELFEVNSNSKFHLYYNDYWLYGALQATVGNGIPKSNYDIVLLSDGAGTFGVFNSCFNTTTEEAHATYETLKSNYQTLLTQIAEKKRYNLVDTDFVISADQSRKLAYVITKEESNVEWWVTGIDYRAIAPSNTEIFNEFRALSTAEGGNKVKTVNFSTYFSALDEDGKEYMKNLFKLGDNLFQTAKEQGKQAMIFLGTHDLRASGGENKEYNFDLYARATMAFYGHEDYVYYYKGHPATPADTIPQKAKELENIGLIDLPSAIPAEMIILYNPELIYIGYQSSTFQSTTDAQSAGVWGKTQSSFLEGYKNKLETFFSLAKTNASNYGLTVDNENAVLIEIADKDAVTGEITGVSKIAVYECSYNADGSLASESIKYYAKNTATGTFDLVTD